MRAFEKNLRRIFNRRRPVRDFAPNYDRVWCNCSLCRGFFHSDRYDWPCCMPKGPYPVKLSMLGTQRDDGRFF